MKPMWLHQIDVGARKRGVLARLVAVVHRAQERTRQRRALSDLSDARLRDIGLTRHEVEGEIAKPFWR
jgi:uncharacterized protein YjiS (DUF1127 family)